MDIIQLCNLREVGGLLHMSLPSGEHAMVCRVQPLEAWGVVNPLILKPFDFGCVSIYDQHD